MTFKNNKIYKHIENTNKINSLNTSNLCVSNSFKFLKNYQEGYYLSAVNGYIEFVPPPTLESPEIIGITIDNNEIDYDEIEDTLIGTFNIIGGTTPIITIISDLDDKFKIGGLSLDKLLVKNTFNYKLKKSHNLTVRASDVYLKTYDEDFTINLTIPPHVSSNCIQINNGVSNEYLINNSINGTDLDFTGDFTISYWINCPNNSSFSHIVLGSNPSTYKFAIFNNGTSGDVLRVYIYDNVGNRKDFQETSPTDWSNNLWHHICITYSSNNPKIYIDGTESGISYFTNQTLGSLRSINDIMIGTRYNAPQTVTNAKYDEITMWNTELSNSDVLLLSASQNYNPWSHPKSNNLIVWYDYEELVSNQIIDKINGYNLNAVNIDNSNIISI